MSLYRRWFVEGGTYFFTVVTQGRKALFRDPRNRKWLREAIRDVRGRAPFRVLAIVLLPDHLHTVWTLPRGDADYSGRWRQIKSLFTRSYASAGRPESCISAQRKRRHEHGVWQRRFWEHTVRDEDDLKRCVDYLHFNPVKHGLVAAVRDWPWSSFHRFVKLGEYDLRWGGHAELHDDMYE